VRVSAWSEKLLAADIPPHIVKHLSVMTELNKQGRYDDGAPPTVIAVNVLWTAAWILRKRCADPADLNRCILRSRELLAPAARCDIRAAHACRTGNATIRPAATKLSISRSADRIRHDTANKRRLRRAARSGMVAARRR
jgi:hypothetical protein